MQKNSKSAWIIALYTAIYLVSAWLQINVQFSLGVFAYLLYPALFALFLPAPVLALVGLADSSWLLGPWPNNGGFFLLIAVYTLVAFWVVKMIGHIINSCADMREDDGGTLQDMPIQHNVPD